MEEIDKIFKKTKGFNTNPFVIIDALVLHPNGWCIEGKALEGKELTPEFWLEIQNIGWLHFELVLPSYNIRKGTWLATEYRLGDCPAPCRSFSLQGVLWTRRAAIEAHQSICAYERGLDRFS